MDIKVTDLSGRTHLINGTDGWTLMEAIRDSGLAMKAECGGCASCATCHVRIDPQWLPALPSPTADEQQVFADQMTVTPESRLACQIVLRPEYRGLLVSLTPDSSAEEEAP